MNNETDILLSTDIEKTKTSLFFFVAKYNINETMSEQKMKNNNTLKSLSPTSGILLLKILFYSKILDKKFYKYK